MHLSKVHVWVCVSLNYSTAGDIRICANNCYVFFYAFLTILHTAESFMYKVPDARVNEKNVPLQALTLPSWSQAARVAKKTIQNCTKLSKKI